MMHFWVWSARVCCVWLRGAKLCVRVRACVCMPACVCVCVCGMVWCVALHCVVLFCCAVLCCAVLYCVVLCCVVVFARARVQNAVSFDRWTGRHTDRQRGREGGREGYIDRYLMFYAKSTGSYQGETKRRLLLPQEKLWFNFYDTFHCWRSEKFQKKMKLNEQGRQKVGKQKKPF